MTPEDRAILMALGAEVSAMRSELADARRELREVRRAQQQRQDLHDRVRSAMDAGLIVPPSVWLEPDCSSERMVTIEAMWGYWPGQDAEVGIPLVEDR